jgi:hypothetical protein
MYISPETQTILTEVAQDSIATQEKAHPRGMGLRMLELKTTQEG